MASNSASRAGLAELWKMGVSPYEACNRFSEAKGKPIGVSGFIVAALNSINSTLKISTENSANPEKSAGIALEKHEQIMAGFKADEAQARNWLIRQLNGGRQIGIGRRVYSDDRTELSYLWDGRLIAKRLDWPSASYRGPSRLFRDIRVLARKDFPEELLSQFDRLRSQGTGRPRYSSVPAAIKSVANRDTQFDDKGYFKEAAYLVEREIAEMRAKGETDEEPSASTIESAIRKRRRNLT